MSHRGRCSGYRCPEPAKAVRILTVAGVAVMVKLCAPHRAALATSSETEGEHHERKDSEESGPRVFTRGRGGV